METFTGSFAARYDPLHGSYSSCARKLELGRKKGRCFGMASIQICAFGRGGVRIGRCAKAWDQRPQDKTLLVYLATLPNGVDADHIWHDLWPQSKGVNVVHQHIRTLREQLGDRGLILHQCGLYSLNGSVTLDRNEYEQALIDAMACRPEDRQPFFERMIELHTGPFLAGVSNVWAESQRSAVAATQAYVYWHLAALAYWGNRLWQCSRYLGLSMAIEGQSSLALVDYLRLLDQAGNRRRACEVYRLHAERMQEMYQVDPAPPVCEIMAAWRDARAVPEAFSDHFPFTAGTNSEAAEQPRHLALA